MMRHTWALAGLALPVALVVPTSPATAAATICVGPGAGCQPTLAAALVVAQDGDTVQLGPGTFTGGVVIERSITLVGAGAGQTTIKGGGPVIEVGRLFAPATGQRVRIEGVTITGGFTRTFPGRQEAPAIAAGGGIRIPWTADFGPGADVTVVDSAVTGNRVSPPETIVIPPDIIPCPGDGCPFAGAFGGGIAAWGPLHLIRTAVTDNRAGSVAATDDVSSDAQGGGVRVGSAGSLTMVDSTVSGNVAAVKPPNGRFAVGGGIESAYASMDVTGSRITGNRADVRASVADDPAYPPGGSNYALGGGLDAVLNDHVRIARSTIADNIARGINLAGTSRAFAGGMLADLSRLELRGSVVSSNQMITGLSGSPFDAGGGVGGLDLVGVAGTVSTVTGSTISGNTIRAVSGTGSINIEGGGAGVYPSLEAPERAVMSDTEISGNRVLASTRGRLDLFGAGLTSFEDLTLLRTRVVGNTADVRGSAGNARGGGIYAGAIGDSASALTAARGSVVGNVIKVGGGLSAGGGGIFAEFAVILSGTPVVGNSPDPQCEGCDGSAARTGRLPTSVPAPRPERERSTTRLFS